MRFVLLNQDTVALEFEMNFDSNVYSVSDLIIHNVNALPTSFKSQMLIVTNDAENLSSAVKFDVTKLTQPLLHWIASRQLSPLRPNADKVYRTYESDLIKFVSMSLCLSADDSFWVVEKDRYVHATDQYLFENAQNIREVCEYKKLILEKTLGLKTEDLSGRTELSNEEFAQFFDQTFAPFRQSLTTLKQHYADKAKSFEKELVAEYKKITTTKRTKLQMH